MILKDLYRRKLEQRQRSAFTLLEVLVVVAIIVILASVASIYVFRYLDDAKKDKAKLQAKAISDACKAYYLRYDEIPPNAQALINPGQGEKPFLQGGEEAIKTPWGGIFQVNEPEQRGDSLEFTWIIRWTDADGNNYQYPAK